MYVVSFKGVQVGYLHLVKCPQATAKHLNQSGLHGWVVIVSEWYSLALLHLEFDSHTEQDKFRMWGGRPAS